MEHWGTGRKQLESGAAAQPVRWSVAIPAHNCAEYLARALPTVINQLGDRADAEIIVVDDCSTDGVEQVVKAHGDRVRYMRNSVQLGAIGVFNRCIDLSRGELVHILHGDDAVLEGFYETFDRAFAAHPEAMTAVCRTRRIDEVDRVIDVSRQYRAGTGVWKDALEAVAVSNRVRAPSIVVRRLAYERVGKFSDSLPHAADWEMWVRLLAAGPTVFIDDVLASYRRHSAQDTAKRMRTGSNIRERRRAIPLLAAYLPEARRSKVVRLALLYTAIYASRTSFEYAKEGEWVVARAQAREAVGSLVRAPLGLRAARPARFNPAEDVDRPSGTSGR